MTEIERRLIIESCRWLIDEMEVTNKFCGPELCELFFDGEPFGMTVKYVNGDFTRPDKKLPMPGTCLVMTLKEIK